MSAGYDDDAPVEPMTSRGRDWPCLRQFGLFMENKVGALQNMLHRIMQWLYRTYEAIRVHTVSMWSDESGMSTVEYAIGTIAAAAFGAVLIAVVKSDSVQQSLLNIIQQALNIH